jgi:hypothetical protein
MTFSLRVRDHFLGSMVALLCFSSGCGSEQADGEGGGTPNGEGAASGEGGEGGGASKAQPWDPGCGDVVSCSFWFRAISEPNPSVLECLQTSCAAAIDACGVDGGVCAAATRCGDDPIHEDFEAGCFTTDPAVYNTWDCYFDRPACAALRDDEPAARDFLQCAADCLGGWSPTCPGFPPACSVLP